MERVKYKGRTIEPDSPGAWWAAWGVLVKAAEEIDEVTPLLGSEHVEVAEDVRAAISMLSSVLEIRWRKYEDAIASGYSPQQAREMAR